MEINKISYWLDNKYSFLRVILLLIISINSVLVAPLLFIIYLIFKFQILTAFFSNPVTVFIFIYYPAVFSPLNIWWLINYYVILVIKMRMRKKESKVVLYYSWIKFYLRINFYSSKIELDYDYSEENSYSYKKIDSKNKIFNYKKEVDKYIYITSFTKLALLTFLFSAHAVSFLLWSLVFLGVIPVRRHPEKDLWLGLISLFISIFLFWISLKRNLLLVLYFYNYKTLSIEYSSFALAIINFLSFRFSDAKRCFKFFKNRIRLNKIDKSLDLEKVVFLGQKTLENYTSTFYTIDQIKILNKDQNYDLISVLKSFCTQTQNQNEFIYRGINIKVIPNPFKNQSFIEEFKTFENSAFYLLMMEFCSEIINRINNKQDFKNDIKILDILVEGLELDKQLLKNSLENLENPQKLQKSIKFDSLDYYNSKQIQQIFDFLK
ncbi:hypothetical protein [Mycoplasma procyoni]|uniref:hypothetical protein n=1 Tax=Mycoplasma procyoni TaxID=568784 RepID=UPI00197B577B|nr:hypothetical protein [Mycoplasma procyoni]MBN3535108.1 hypothetical protein [Mycoplasma procyoni]